MRVQEDFEGAFEAATRQRAGALVAPGDPLVTNRPRMFADPALKYRLPTMVENKEMAIAGALLSLGPNIVDSYRRAATHVDKILKGAKPGDLPMEQPTKFDLFINLKTAKALGLTIPPSVAPAAGGSGDRVMERRAFLTTLAGGLLAAPLAAQAQPAGKVWRIGVIGYAPKTADMIGPNPKTPVVSALLAGLRELGYVYGQHYVTEPRGAEGKQERFANIVADLIRLRVDVIVGVSASLPALKQATSTIPIVIPGTPDPVSSGYAQSLGRPGGNFTGLSFQMFETIGKRLELLKQLVPTPAPVAVLWDSVYPQGWEAAQAAARQGSWNLLSLPLRDVGEVDQAFRSATNAQADAVLVAAGRTLDPHSQRVVDLATKSRLPAMYHHRYFVEVGGLVCYAPNLNEIWRAAATFVDKIFRGAKPANLPIEQPTKFELVINLKTAKALGLTIPPSLLARADQVIE